MFKFIVMMVQENNVSFPYFWISFSLKPSYPLFDIGQDLSEQS